MVFCYVHKKWTKTQGVILLCGNHSISQNTAKESFFLHWLLILYFLLIMSALWLDRALHFYISNGLILSVLRIEPTAFALKYIPSLALLLYLGIGSPWITKLSGLALNMAAFCLSLMSDRITGPHHHYWLDCVKYWHFIMCFSFLTGLFLLHPYCFLHIL